MVNASEWKKWSIGELVSQTKTTIQTGPFGTVLSSSEFVDYGIPVISVREIREGFIRITDETPCVTDDTFSRLGKYALSSNDIVFARKGSVDRSAVIPEGTKRFFLGSDGIRIRFDQNVVSPDLMLCIFQSPSTKQFLIQSSYGTTMAGLNEKILCSLEFYLPDTVAEQKNIARILADIDKYLAIIEEMIAKKKAIKHGAMQELLIGKKRLPEFSGEWHCDTMRQYLGFQVGFPFSSQYFNEKGNGFRLVKNRDLRSDDQVYFTTEQCLSEFVVKNGDILVGMDGDFLPCRWMKGIALLNQRVGKLMQKGAIDLLFAYYALEKPLLELQVGTGATTVKHLSHKDVCNLSVWMPPTLDEQKAIAEILSNMDSEIEALEQKLEKYRQVKQGMMQQLLTGKIRLTEDR